MSAPTVVTTPSWYDVLGVDLQAGADEVRAAWKAGIADLEPSDRRFRLLNEAAEVLLDPDRRATYDAELAAQEPASEHEPADEPVETHARATSWTPPGWVLAVAAALAAVVAGACGVLAATQPSDASVADATREAQVAAERAIVPILSYDARRPGRLAADQRAAEAQLTAGYREQYDKLFEVIRDNAPRTRTVVSTEVVASGVVRSGDDRVSVLVFVNRPTTNKQVERPVVYKDQVTMTMQKVGDAWLVDDLVTSPAAG